MQRRGIQIGLSILLGVILIFCQMAPGQASDLEKKKDELSQVNRQIEEQKKQLNDNQKKEKNILQELNTIDQDISQTSKDLDRIDGELTTLQQSINQTEEQLQKKEEALQERTGAFHQRLRDIYVKGNLSYLEVLLESTSMSDFLTRFDLLKCIADQDAKLMKEMAAERDIIARQKSELLSQKEAVVVLKRTTTAKQNYLASRKQDREVTMENLQSDRSAFERAIQELEASSQQLTRIIQQLSKPSNPEPRKGTGRFIWPASGPITSYYGMRLHSVLGVYKMHTGIDIGASYGSPVKAADGGSVIFVGSMGGYGNVVVIDHGGGITTLYAHLSSYSVSSGSSVSQGQVIARVGSTGWSTGPHLHFEVRVNGNHTDPLGYL